MIRLLIRLGLMLLSGTNALAEGTAHFEIVDTPAGPGAREPALFASPSGQLLMSWLEPNEDGFALRLATFEDDVWGDPFTVVSSSDLFVNWADFPSAARLGDGTLVAHWLRKTGIGPYEYEINLAFSDDEGRTWGDPVVPHLDGTSAQHGFVTLVPQGDEVAVIWLDGRANDGGLIEPGDVEGAMQLHMAILGPEGASKADIGLDLMTCSCCQTDAVRAEESLLVVYRDRTEEEIRDISILRLTDGLWSVPEPVHNDGWEIAGCPVNGPAIASAGEQVVVAWFTGARNIPEIRVAFSDDAGASFGAPLRIDLGQPVGRVDALMRDDGSALVSWVEWEGSDEHLVLCEATPEGCRNTTRVATNSAGASVNFPRLVATGTAIYLAWTRPLPDGTDTIRMIRRKL